MTINKKRRQCGEYEFRINEYYRDRLSNAEFCAWMLVGSILMCGVAVVVSLMIWGGQP